MAVEAGVVQSFTFGGEMATVTFFCVLTLKFVFFVVVFLFCFAFYIPRNPVDSR